MKHHYQETDWTCGPAAMRIALADVKIEKSEKELSKLLQATEKHGVSHKAFPKAAKKLELCYHTGKNMTMRQLQKTLQAGFRVIICYYDKKNRYGHYSLVRRLDKKKIYLLDPEYGPLHSYNRSYFKRIWHGSHAPRGWYIALKKQSAE